MKTTPCNTDDVIDSRDVIERLEELEALRKPFTAGWNMPGYMPDNDPVGFETWQDAAEYIAGEIRRALEEFEPTEEDAESYEDAACRAENSDDAQGYGETVGSYHYWITQSDSPFEDPDDAAEYEALKAFAKEFEDRAADYAYGETAIRDSYFEQYAMELADDIGAVPSDVAWPCTCIDWDMAARELKQDYMSIEFDGVTYWTR